MSEPRTEREQADREALGRAVQRAGLDPQAFKHDIDDALDTARTIGGQARQAGANQRQRNEVAEAFGETVKKVIREG